MFKKQFETNNPIFFITDSKQFNFIEFEDLEKEFTTYSDTTISLQCADATDDEETTLEIYIDEAFIPSETIQKIFVGTILIPSGTLDIAETNTTIFSQNFTMEKINVTVYIKPDYKNSPNYLFIVITT